MFNLLRMNANEITHSSKNNRTDSTPRRLKLRRLSLLCLLYSILHYLSVCITADRAGRESLLNLRQRLFFESTHRVITVIEQQRLVVLGRTALFYLGGATAQRYDRKEA